MVLKTVGIFGGTFDPIHFGHLITAQTLVEKRKLSKIIFVPSFTSPHKINYKYSEPEHRFNMTKLAISSHPNFDISDFEINRDEVSYTYNTLAEFAKKYESLELIIGFDNLISFDLWYKADEIVKIADLVVLKRTYDKEIKKPNKFFSDAIFVDTPTIEISSTEIRKRVSKNLPIDYFVPQTVKEYIHENKLYLNYK
ncbi:MAG: nicotinate (nicotinamide) nucleotide adenylyltransferase [Ignavibacteriales bacterium]|nr:nicotinate (nicotinamide) nucleotide adenylyltransferase [Ignavibacteriales bacterium]